MTSVTNGRQMEQQPPCLFGMSAAQRRAILAPCYFDFEAAQAKFLQRGRYGSSIMLTVLAGHEAMERGYGGPVWQASVLGADLSRRVLERIALEYIGTAGYASMQWTHWTPGGVVVRRRLRPGEASAVPGGLRDLRGTDEAQTRWEAARKWLPKEIQVMALAEIKAPEGKRPAAGALPRRPAGGGA